MKTALAVIGGPTVFLLGALFSWSMFRHHQKRIYDDAMAYAQGRAAARKTGEST
jgi:hypothetical protein